MSEEVVENGNKNYCFSVKNNSTASFTFDICDYDLEKVKNCYLKFSVLQRSLLILTYFQRNFPILPISGIVVLHKIPHM